MYIDDIYRLLNQRSIGFMFERLFKCYRKQSDFSVTYMKEKIAANDKKIVKTQLIWITLKCTSLVRKP